MVYVNKMSQLAKPGFFVKMAFGAVFQQVSVTHQSQISLDSTTFVFTFKLVNDLPPNA